MAKPRCCRNPAAGRAARRRPRQGLCRRYGNAGAQSGLVGTIYARARNNIEEPAHLHRLVRLIDAET